MCKANKDDKMLMAMLGERCDIRRSQRQPLELGHCVDLGLLLHGQGCK